jgi:ribosomal protein S18 acetylase RimI-like enzyme
MLVYKRVSEENELKAILALQQLNLKENIPAEEKEDEGFLTLSHSLNVLKLMHVQMPSIIAKDNDQLAGYALVMTADCRNLVPDLESMFTVFDTLNYLDRPLSEWRYYVMGQICVARKYRGQGVFDGLYNKHKELMQNNYDLLITEISRSNQRSLKAHERVGFKTIHTHKDELDDWLVVAWDFKNSSL